MSTSLLNMLLKIELYIFLTFIEIPRTASFLNGKTLIYIYSFTHTFTLMFTLSQALNYEDSNRENPHKKTAKATKQSMYIVLFQVLL